MISVTWYRHGHEARNDYLRWSLVRLADAGRIAYRERPQAAGAEAGMSAGLIAHEHRHTSVLSIEDGPRRRLVAIDNEDGFTHLQPFVDEVDAYFCCPFTSAFHREKSFPDPLPWQTEADVADYRAQAARLVERHGDHFDKVRPLVPTPTQMVVYESFTPTERRGVLWAHRVRKAALWDHLREARRSGLAVLLVSADLEELIGLSDRLVVMLRGRLVAELDPSDTTPESLGSAMTGVSA